MSTITSSSTIAQVQASYVDNASYAEDGSAAKAKTFLTACRVLLLKLRAQAGTREGTMRLNPELIQREMGEAREWLAANGEPVADNTDGGRVTRASFREFRA